MAPDPPYLNPRFVTEYQSITIRKTDAMTASVESAMSCLKGAVIYSGRAQILQSSAAIKSIDRLENIRIFTGVCREFPAFVTISSKIILFYSGR